MTTTPVYFPSGVCGKSWSDLWKQVEFVSSTPPSPDIGLVPLDILKKQCRLPTAAQYANNPDDDLLIQYSKAAEPLIEAAIEGTLRAQVFNLHLTEWPGYNSHLNLRWEKPPLISVNYIKYYDTEDVQQTLSSSKYEIWGSKSPPSILIRSINVPELSVLRSKVVEVNVTAGFVGHAIDDARKQLISLVVAFWYMNKESYGRLPLLADGAQGRMFTDLVTACRWRVY